MASVVGLFPVVSVAAELSPVVLLLQAVMIEMLNNVVKNNLAVFIILYFNHTKPAEVFKKAAGYLYH